MKKKYETNLNNFLLGEIYLKRNIYICVAQCFFAQKNFLLENDLEAKQCDKLNFYLSFFFKKKGKEELLYTICFKQKK